MVDTPIIDALEHDLTQWDSGAEFSLPSRPPELASPDVVDMTIGDSDEFEASEGFANVSVDETAEVSGPAVVNAAGAQDDPELLLQDTESIDGFEESAVGNEDSWDIESVEEVTFSQPRGAQIAAAFGSLDQVDTGLIFQTRASVMKSVPKFLKGPFKNAVKVALEEALAREEVRQVRGGNSS